ncbi:hypothetical protein DdX_08806 [Ditylenchus destructor]|uniref:Uncharacterized protein n=1 Tax=Ditylenchus destructor TaxID=166010 RepID=A0AAD4N0V2_9BILA|nr:hypothetical protein DdX_08806 [Ditylenchus destructor]
MSQLDQKPKIGQMQTSKKGEGGKGKQTGLLPTHLLLQPLHYPVQFNNIITTTTTSKVALCGVPKKKARKSGSGANRSSGLRPGCWGEDQTRKTSNTATEGSVVLNKKAAVLKNGAGRGTVKSNVCDLENKIAFQRRDWEGPFFKGELCASNYALCDNRSTTVGMVIREPPKPLCEASGNPALSTITTGAAMRRTDDNPRQRPAGWTPTQNPERNSSIKLESVDGGLVSSLR